MADVERKWKLWVEIRSQPDKFPSNWWDWLEYEKKNRLILRLTLIRCDSFLKLYKVIFKIQWRK